jgi:hypothetical protein
MLLGKSGTGCGFTVAYPGFPYMDPAPVQRGLERDEVNPVASIYPASVNGALSLPRALMDFRASSLPYRFAGL